MKTEPLNDLQRLVTKHYANGEYSHHECHIPGDTGDTLFDFVMSEADEDCYNQAADQGMTPATVLLARVVNATAKLVALQDVLLKQIILEGAK